MTATPLRRRQTSEDYQLARVLLVDNRIASRLTLKTLLEAGGYSVDVAASSPEAVSKLDGNQYELVLSDGRLETPGAGLKLLSYARTKEYRPATALVSAYPENSFRRNPRDQQQICVDSRDLTAILSKVADLISARAMRRSERALRHATA